MQLTRTGTTNLPGPPSDAAVMLGGFIVFTTQGDNKDWDTKCQVSIGPDVHLNPWVVVYLPFTHNDQDRIDNGQDRFAELGWTVPPSTITWSQMKHASVAVFIRPVGHDTWDFVFRLILAASDNNWYDATVNQVVSLSQDNMALPLVPLT